MEARLLTGAPLTVGVVGLGLIGGSLVRALSERTSHRVLGCDKDPDTLKKALADGSIQAELNDETLPACDVLLIALYPRAAVGYLAASAPLIAQGAVVMDCCGVKRAVYTPMQGLADEYGFTYVGGHPMAGREQSGYCYARADLFSGASMILTPPPGIRGELLDALCGFFASLGFGGVRWSTPEEHDRMIAYTSQLAHVLSSAYIKSPTALKHSGFSAGSFQDMTRVAYLNESMWTELFLDNANYLVEEIEGLSRRLLEYSQAIRERRPEELSELLAEGRRRKELVEGRKPR